jgi:hypothetical protein
MRNSKGQFRSKRPTDEEIRAMMILVKGGWARFEYKG